MLFSFLRFSNNFFFTALRKIFNTFDGGNTSKQKQRQHLLTTTIIGFPLIFSSHSSHFSLIRNFPLISIFCDILLKNPRINFFQFLSKFNQICRNLLLLIFRWGRVWFTLYTIVDESDKFKYFVNISSILATFR